VKRLPLSLALTVALLAGCRHPPPEDPAEKIYRGAVQLFAQASAASQDLTYRDPRFDAVLAALAKVPEGSEFRPDADALAERIRTAREKATAADAESQKAIERALARPEFESQGKVVATQGSAVTPRPASKAAPSAPGVAPSAEAVQSSEAAARAIQRSLSAGEQEPPDVAPETQAVDNASPSEPESAPPARASASRPPPPPPPPTPPGQIFGLPGPAGRAMGTRP
jgi:hypothetical protein